MQINRTFLNDFCNYFTFLRTTLRYNAAFLRTTTSVIHYVKDRFTTIQTGGCFYLIKPAPWLSVVFITVLLNFVFTFHLTPPHRLALSLEHKPLATNCSVQTLVLAIQLFADLLNTLY